MEKVNISSDLFIQAYLPLRKYGYIPTEILNNRNRWHTKIVCNILGKDFKHYVSTSYARRSDYLKLLETTAYLKCNNKLSPKIVKIYPDDKTIICNYIGEFLSDYLLGNPADISPGIISVFDYLRDLNSINLRHKEFTIPPIIKEVFQLADEIAGNFIFLPKTKSVLPQLADSEIEFTYGCGIEDPHIWNFRIVQTRDGDETRALTTDFDYFSEDINYFWESGYFYATLRWFKKDSVLLGCEAEKILLSLVQKQGLKSEFMFWLGALSSYCGYKESLCNFITADRTAQRGLGEQYKIVRFLDEKVSYLIRKLLKNELKKKIEKHKIPSAKIAGFN